MDDLREIIEEFITESRDNLDRLDQDFVVLEKNPQDSERLASVFRTIHSIKGTCGFFGFRKLENLTHVGESLLSQLRDGKLILNTEITNALLAMVDAVREMLAAIEQTHQDGDGDYAELIARLSRLQNPQAAAPSAAPPAPSASTTARDRAADNGSSGKRHKLLLGELLVRMGQITPQQLEQALQEKQKTQGRIGDILKNLFRLDANAIEEALKLQAEEERRNTVAVDNTLRIEVGQLDQLMDLVGELVLTRNHLLRQHSSKGDTSTTATQRLNLITNQLQERVMKMRMQSIDTLWNKFPRVVRDLAVACGKQVRLEVEGQETELDKTLIEAIKDPLTHLVRNAVDHGIERPEIRLQSGKPEEGKLVLRSYHENGQVNIEVSDDGAGIQPERIRNKALERGLITRDQAARMSNHELLHLIFLPGFSTAEKVTNVSGRGVGMDVVKTNIEKIGGTVELLSQPGQGTTVKIRIPLTLAIIPALIVTSGRERYALPQVNLVELVRLRGEQAVQAIEMIHGTPVYRLRGQLLPLIFLDLELGLRQREHGAETSGASGNEHLFDFDAAIWKHRQWKHRLQEFLEKGTGLTLAEVVSPRDCALGKWLYGDGIGRYGYLEEFRRLEKAHAEMHEIIKRIVLRKSAGDEAGARAEFGSYAGASERVVELLQQTARLAARKQGMHIVVLQAEDKQFGLVVDQIIDTEEIVVKPLGKLLKGIPVFAGATIMGDGRVALILDVVGLARQGNVLSELREHSRSVDISDHQQGTRNRQAVLLVQAGEEGRLAIPLSQVARLEKFSAKQVERTRHGRVVKYRNEIMPLIDLGEALSGYPMAETGRSGFFRVVVHSYNQRTFGLVVDRIIDIVEETLDIQRREPCPGILGSAVIQGRVIDVVDVPGIVATFRPRVMRASRVLDSAAV